MRFSMFCTLCFAAVAAGALSVPARAGEDGSSALRWKFGLQVQADHRDIAGEDGHFLWRRVRPSVEAQLGSMLTLKLVPELRDGDVQFADFYLDVATHPAASLRMGRIKTPVNLERLQSGSTSAFNERGFTSELTPSRDLGIQLYGKLADARIEYALGVFNGAPDGRNGHSANPDDTHDAVARLAWQPWKGGDGPLSGLTLGLGFTQGNRHGAGDAFLPRYRTQGQSTFFRYRGTVLSDGKHTRWAPQLAWNHGSFGLLGEYVSSRQWLRDGASDAHQALEHHAWHVVGRWALTGEKVQLRGISKPNRPYAPGNGQWGALEAVARLGRLQIDEDAFPLFANAESSASSARAWGLGLNWYPNNHLKLAANYSQTRLGHAFTPASRRGDEHAFFTRLQLTF